MMLFAPVILAVGLLAHSSHQHDFDFEFGFWRADLRMVQHPLSGSQTWTELRGTSVVRKVWDGRANLGELEVGNATTHLEGLSLRLYDPQSDTWRVYFANSAGGPIGVPSVGRFSNGRGLFYDDETMGGKPIRVRFEFSNITPHSFRFEQSFSTDHGTTWKPNWIAVFTR